jgi:tripartite-type tricarboxylate transporter receptor subunit TctC
VKKIVRIIAVLASVLPALAAAQAYPSKPVIVVVSTVPGPLDAFARIVCQKLQDSLKQPFVVENKAGAGGNIAADFVRNQPADGYTLLFAIDTTFTVNPGLYKSNLPFDPEKHFATISVPVTYGQMLTVPTGLPVKTVGEFVALAKQKPLTYASGGNGSPSHLVAAYFASAANLELTHVPYKGTGQSVIDALAGRVDTLFAVTSGVLPYVKDGRLRALAVSSDKRSALAPDLPTIAESGYPGFDVSFAYALMAPAGTPPQIVRLLNREVQKALAAPDVVEKDQKWDYAVTGFDEKQSAQWLRESRDKWTKVIDKQHIAIE